ncbi:hypothetical protein Metev_0907 [Methanohalobium evestigatum Z-7303]|uniref:Uncharacterized protein n=1 Tax=Methanohalobium evestigatum (strain ATCC BAA-1072 / DSM 3721 / NBRC 107634 / OCM 161 / Z-7303) TaxID=644295 RepID=D7E8Y2_METEZ|nr:hypothetical protein Metev_0907 [Methanohalobium evestigatum Z-7303]
MINGLLLIKNREFIIINSVNMYEIVPINAKALNLIGL